MSGSSRLCQTRSSSIEARSTRALLILFGTPCLRGLHGCVRIRHGEPLHFAIEVQVDEADEWHRGEDAISVAFASMVGAIVESTTDGPEHKRALVEVIEAHGRVRAMLARHRLNWTAHWEASGSRRQIVRAPALRAARGRRASRRNVDRREHKQHADDRVKQDGGAVRSRGHDVSPSSKRMYLTYERSGAPSVIRITFLRILACRRSGEGAFRPTLSAADWPPSRCRQNQRFAQIIALCAEAGETTVRT